MTVSADEMTGDLRIKLDRKPIETKAEEELLMMMKTKYGFGWVGYAEKGKWHAKKDAVAARNSVEAGSPVRHGGSRAPSGASSSRRGSSAIAESSFVPRRSPSISPISSARA